MTGVASALADGGPFILLASYPKSGNTWVRAMLSAYLSPGELDIARLLAPPILCSRGEFDEFTGLASADLSLDEIDLARPAFHAALGDTCPAPWFVKVHDAWYRNASGVPVFGPESCRGVVYIVRHPAALLWSFAHHRVEPPARTAAFMACEDALHDWWDHAIDTRLPQRMFSWSTHVAGWLDQSELPVLLLRYEDMVRDPPAALGSILRFAGLPVDDAGVDRAVAAASFERLQAMEVAGGFREAPAGPPRFFRSGRADAWRDRIEPALRDRIARDHGAVMDRLGYAA